MYEFKKIEGFESTDSTVMINVSFLDSKGETQTYKFRDLTINWILRSRNRYLEHGDEFATERIESPQSKHSKTERVVYTIHNDDDFCILEAKAPGYKPVKFKITNEFLHDLVSEYKKFKRAC